MKVGDVVYKRWPKHELMWRRGFQSMHDKFKGVPKRDGGPRALERFDTPEEHFKFWMEDENVNDTDPARLSDVPVVRSNVHEITGWEVKTNDRW